jgi:uncharacterized protein (DUF1778 family)
MTTGSINAPRRKPRSARLVLRGTPEQESVLRCAADTAHKSLTDLILESACQVAEQTLIHPWLFVASDAQAQFLPEVLERPAEDNVGLRDLFDRPEPWQTT